MARCRKTADALPEDLRRLVTAGSTGEVWLMGLPAPEVDRLWESFHRVVNMASRELRDWLASEPAQEVPELLPDDPDARETGLGAETYGDDR